MKRIIYILFAVLFIVSCSKQEPMVPVSDGTDIFMYDSNFDITDPDKNDEHDGDGDVITDPEKEDDHDKDVNKQSKD